MSMIIAEFAQLLRRARQELQLADRAQVRAWVDEQLPDEPAFYNDHVAERLCDQMGVV